MRQDDLLDICEDDLPETVSMRLKCGGCGHVARYETETVYIDAEFRDKSKPPKDYVSFSSYFRCRKCKSAWPWEFTPDAVIAVTGLMLLKVAGVDDDRLVFGNARMYDGTRFRSPAQAEDHLLGILEREPDNAFVWNRLGNVYKRAGLIPKASKAFEKALEIDPDEIESRYSLGSILLDKRKYEQSAQHLRRVLKVAHGHDELTGGDLRQTVRSTLGMLSEIHARTDGDIDGMSFQNNEPAHEPMKIRLECFDLSDEEDLERAVDMFIGKQKRSAPPPARPIESRRKTGRNEPCPCGSGVKYKRCCGR
jgi:hypothetical protein